MNIFMLKKITVILLVSCMFIPIASANVKGTSVDSVTEAQYLGTDFITKGNWVGVYGADGYILPHFTVKTINGFEEKEPDNIEKLPSYLSPTKISAAYWVFENPSKNDAALQVPDKSKKIKMDVYANKTMQFTMPITDDVPHMVSLYMYSGGAASLAEQSVEICDSKGAVLDKQIVDLSKPRYLTYSIKGTFIIRLTNISSNAMLNGIFFDECIKETPTGVSVKLSTSTKRAVDIKWVVTSTDSKIIVVRKSSLQTKFDVVAVTDEKAGSYVDANLDSNISYDYRIRKLRNNIYSQPTDKLNVKMPTFSKTNIQFADSNAISCTNGDRITLRALVIGEDGNPIAGRTVSFELDGKNVGDYINKDIGTVVTNESGMAEISYETKYGGQFIIKAISQYDDIKEIAQSIDSIPLLVKEITAGVPIIFSFSEAVKPGDLIRVNGSDINKTGLKIMAKYNSGKAEKEPPADAKDLKIIDTDSTGIYAVAQLPEDAQAGMYDLWVSNECGWSKPIKINGPRLSWLSEKETAEGLVVTAVGRNFNAKEYGKDAGFMQVRLVGENGDAYGAKLIGFNPYAVEFTTLGIPLGEYNVEVRSDNSGEWVRTESEQKLTVIEKGDDPLNLGVSWAKDFKWDRKYDVTNFGAQGDGTTDNTEAFSKVIEKAKLDGGGVVYIPNGTYCVKTIKLPADIVLMGEDKIKTILMCIGAGKDTFISSVDDGAIVGRTGVANFTIDSKTVDNWSARKYGVWLGHTWGDAVYHLEKRTASKLFIANLNTEIYKKYKFMTGMSTQGTEYAVIKDNYGLVLGSAYITRYAHVFGNMFEYNAGSPQMVSLYLLYENNHIVGHPEEDHEMHGFSARSCFYAYNNVHEKTGATDNPRNDGESFLIEGPGAYFDVGDVLRTDGLKLEVTKAFVNYKTVQIRQEPLSIQIIDGRGTGQYREIQNIDKNIVTVKKPWNVQPDSTSKYTIIIPIDRITLYRNTVLDCGSAVCIYSQPYDDVIAENTIKNSGGIAISAVSIPSTPRSNPAMFIRVDNNYLEDIFIGKRKVNNTTGIFATFLGEYVGPHEVGIEYRRNVIRGVNSTDANGLIIDITGVKERPDYVKNILMVENTIDKTISGFQLSEGAQGVILKGNKVTNTGIPIKGDGAKTAIMLDQNNATGRGAGWTDLSNFNLIEKGPFPDAWKEVNSVFEEKTFVDIQGHWAKSDILEMRKKGIIKGLNEETFGPEQNITRAEFLVLVARAIKLIPVNYNDSFSDVKVDNWYANTIQAVFDKSIIDNGMVSNDSFNPEAPIIREEMTSLVISAYNSVANQKAELGNIDSYKDNSDITAWAVDYVKAANLLGIIKGVSDTEFAPKENATRAQAVVIIKRLLEKL